MDGIYYKFFPLHFKYHSIKIEDISKIEICKLNALADFGGWGIRYNFKSKRIALLMNGNIGLLITKKNNRQIVLTTQKTKIEIIEILSKFNYNKQPQGRP